jgi:hypothetical protein
MKRHYKTVGLIMEEAAWEPQPVPDTAMVVRVAADERTLPQQVKQVGGSGILSAGHGTRATNASWPLACWSA